MYRFRDALLGSEPKGFPRNIGSERNIQDQQDIIECIARGELEEVRAAALHNRTWAITNNYCARKTGVDSLEGSLHSIWHIYYQLSRNTSHDKPDHDSLVLDVLRIQGLGPLTRSTSHHNDIDVARTAQGTLWTDLPFFATDMTDFWVNYAGSMSAAHRLNFATFLAKLASTRVSKDRLCQIALHLFRHTLEEARELHITDQLDHEDTHRTFHNLDHLRLLPSVCAWIKIAGSTLIMLSEMYWADCPSDISHGGCMFVESDLGKRSPLGFTPWRWIYWLKRLHELRDEARNANEMQVEELAADAIECMVAKAKARNSNLVHIYETEGGFEGLGPHT